MGSEMCIRDRLVPVDNPLFSSTSIGVVAITSGVSASASTITSYGKLSKLSRIGSVLSMVMFKMKSSSE